MFEFLQDIFYKPQKKINVSPQKKKSIELDVKNYTKDTNYIKVDSRKYPIINVTPAGIICANSDDTIAINERLHSSIFIKDKYGNFTFESILDVVAIDGKKQFKLEFIMLMPEVEKTLIKYYKLRNTKH